MAAALNKDSRHAKGSKTYKSLLCYEIILAIQFSRRQNQVQGTHTFNTAPTSFRLFPRNTLPWLVQCHAGDPHYNQRIYVRTSAC